MLSIIPAFLIFVSSFLQDPSGSWIPSAESTTFNVFLKSKYISKVGSKITIWIKNVYKEPEVIDGKKVANSLQLYECDCNDFSTRILSSVRYTESSDLINSFDFKDSEKKYAPPGSVAEKFVGDVCTRFNKKKK